MNKSNNIIKHQLFNIQHWQLDGANIYFIAAPEIPFVEIQLAFTAGSCFDQQQLGLSQLTNVMLKRGTASYDFHQINNNLEEVGAEFETDADRDFGFIKLISLSESQYFDQALRVFSSIITEPSFPERAFENIKKRFLGAVEMRSQMPEIIAKDALFSMLYGSHPYAHPVMGIPTAIMQAKRDHLLDFYRTHYVRQHATMSMIGNINKNKAVDIAKSLLEKIAEGALHHYPAVNTPAKKDYQHHYFPSNQTVMLMGTLGIAFHSPDYFPLLIANHILGGSHLNSRLFKQIRIEKGFAYSIMSTISAMKVTGPIAISVQTRQSEAQNTYDLTMSILKNLFQHGPKKREVNDAKSEIINGFPLSLMSTSAKSSYLLHMGTYHLPTNYLDTFQEHIQRVSLAEIHAVIKHYLNPDKMCVVTVGERPITI